MGDQSILRQTRPQSNEHESEIKKKKAKLRPIEIPIEIVLNWNILDSR